MDIKLLIAIVIVLLIAAAALFFIIRKRNPETPSEPSAEPPADRPAETEEEPVVETHTEKPEPVVNEPEAGPEPESGPDTETVSEPEVEPEAEPENEPETEPEIKVEPADEIFLDKLQKIVAENVSDPEFDTRVLIDSMGLSRTMLFNKVKDLTGLNLQNYINKMRMEKAMEMMKTTSIPLAEVAGKCGFTTPRYFSTSFKNYTGKTPSQFKKELFS